MKSATNAVQLQAHEATALVSSARWMQYCIRQEQIGVNADERRVALGELQDAIDAITAQLGRTRRGERTAPWRGYVAAILAVSAATMLIATCYVVGSPRTVVGLYIPVVVGIALLVGRWPALLGCALAFVLNDVLFVHRWQFAPGPEQIAALSVVALSCLMLEWLARTQIRQQKLLGIV